MRDFDSRDGTLTVKQDKAGQGRVLLLPDSAANHLRAMAKDKLPTAPLFSRWHGSAWDKNSWKIPIKSAAASIDPNAMAYTLRHSTVTDLVSAGLDLFTVAALSGTSIAMIEKHYGHLQQDRAQKALAGLSL